MTRTAIYSLQDNTLTERPAMEKPDSKDYMKIVHQPFHEVSCFTDNKYYEDLKKYEAEVAQCRTIPAHDSARSLWKDGQKLVDGKDYEVREEPIPYFDHIDDPVEYRTRAYPIVPVKSEDDLWYKAIDLIMVAHDKGLSKEDAVGVVKSQYIITKR